MKPTWILALAAAGLAACGADTDPAPAADAAPTPPAAEVEEVPAGPAVGSLDWAVAGDWRSEAEKARDVWRNPEATLAFFDVDGDETVAEIWPGGGWYTQILAPYLKENGGQFLAVGFDPSGSEFAANAMKRFNETYVGAPDVYGEIEVSVYSANSEAFAEPGTVDTVLTFRNIHNFMAGGHNDKFFADAFAALKPGGVLGVVEHRLPSTEEQDPAAASGYVHEDYVRAAALAAGFTFDGSAEINANPKDTADHPFGVWTLPPNRRTADREGNTPEDFDASVYESIGESDRMTLKFIKPAE